MLCWDSSPRCFWFEVIFHHLTCRMRADSGSDGAPGAAVRPHRVWTLRQCFPLRRQVQRSAPGGTTDALWCCCYGSPRHRRVCHVCFRAGPDIGVVSQWVLLTVRNVGQRCWAVFLSAWLSIRLSPEDQRSSLLLYSHTVCAYCGSRGSRLLSILSSNQKVNSHNLKCQTIPVKCARLLPKHTCQAAWNMSFFI